MLSIIVPSYNMEEYLPKCLGSLIVPLELMERFEVIVVNDGSKDRTSEIAHEFEKKYPRTFKVIDKENGHYGSCINAALEVASGIYVKVLDADDYFNTAEFRQYLSNLIGLCENGDEMPDVIINERVIVDENGREKTEAKAIRKYRYNTVLGLKEGQLLGGYIPMHNVAHKRVNLLDLGYKQTEGICYTDNEWVQLPFVKAKTFVAYNLKLYSYLCGRYGQSVDCEVLHKNLPMWIQVSKSLLSNYKKYEDAPDHIKSHLKYIAESTINTVYRLSLTPNRFDGEEEQKKEFDMFLRKNFPQIYREVAGLSVKCCGFKLRYIKEWRRRYSRKTWRFRVYDMLRLITGQNPIDF